MNHESCGVLIDHYQTSKLIRCGSFAATIKLRVRLKNAEQLFLVGNHFTENDTSVCGSRHVSCALNKNADCRRVDNIVVEAVCRLIRRQFSAIENPFCPL